MIRVHGSASRAVRGQRTLAGYEIVAKLRVGGMAALYLGRKTGAGGFAKYVAIKVVLEHLAEDPMLIGMFLDEARLSARVEHPNVVHIHELGEEEGQHFLVMEYVAGGSLSQIQRALAKRGRRLTPPLVASIAMQVAAGLHAAHEVTDDHGVSLHVVHRDVSPKNVLIAYKGYVKLIDFGIAKVRDASQATSAGLLKGTIRYMSPEQSAGRTNIDRRSDVFSLGTLMWELLTGRLLFNAENDLGSLDLVRRADAPLPSQFAPVPPALEQVVMRMLSLSPDDRFASCDEVQRAIAAAVPEALSISAQQAGDVVALLVPPPNDGSLDPAVASALGRPSVRDPEALLAWATAPMEGPMTAPPEASSSASGAVPRGSADSQGLTSRPSFEPSSQAAGPLSAASAVAPEPAPDRRRLLVPAIAAVTLLLVAAAALLWSGVLGGAPEIHGAPLPVATTALPVATTAPPPSSEAAAATPWQPEPDPSSVAVGPVPAEAEPAGGSEARHAEADPPPASTETGAPRASTPGHAARPHATETPTATTPEAPETDPTPTTPHRRSRTAVTGDPVISTEF